MVVAPDDFPFPGMLDKSGRIREHRMVMALHLGRELARGEVVRDEALTYSEASRLASLR